MEWILSNLALWINLAALELGLVGGMLFPAWLISERKLANKDAKAFLAYQFFLPFIVVQVTFSSWEFAAYVPVYFGLGVATPVFAVGVYKLFIASVPNLLQNILPPWVTKWFKAKSLNDTNVNNNEISVKENNNV